MATAYPCECGDEPALFTMSSHDTGDTVFLGQQCLTGWAIAWLDAVGLDTGSLLPQGVVGQGAAGADGQGPEDHPVPALSVPAAGGEPDQGVGVAPPAVQTAPGATAGPKASTKRGKAASGPSRAADGQPATSSNG